MVLGIVLRLQLISPCWPLLLSLSYKLVPVSHSCENKTNKTKQQWIKETLPASSFSCNFPLPAQPTLWKQWFIPTSPASPPLRRLHFASNLVWFGFCPHIPTKTNVSQVINDFLIVKYDRNIPVLICLTSLWHFPLLTTSSTWRVLMWTAWCHFFLVFFPFLHLFLRISYLILKSWYLSGLGFMLS